MDKNRSRTKLDIFHFLSLKLYVEAIVINRYQEIYTASKVKHHLNIFLEKIVTLSKHEFILVTFMKIDNDVALYRKFQFDYH